MKAMVYAHKVDTREELLQRILSTARSINNNAVLHKVTSSLVTRVRKCVQADGGHFEQFAWVLKGESVTVHLTTYLNIWTMLFFPFLFIYCALKTRNSWTVVYWTHVYMTFLTQKSALELNPDVVTLTPGTPCIWGMEAQWSSRNCTSTDSCKLWLVNHTAP